MNIKNTYKKHIQLNNKLHDIADLAIEQLDAKELSTTDVSMYELILLSIMAKSRKHYNAVQKLCISGFGEEAGLVVRSMANALIDIGYIAKCGKEKLSERFTRFSWIIKKRKIKIAEMLDEYTKRFNSKEESEKWEKRKQEIFTEVKKFREDYKSKGKERDWSGCSIETKSERAGRGIELIYQTVYRYFSDIDHGNAEALDKYVQSSDIGGTKFLSEPSESHVEETLRESFRIYLAITEEFCKQFELKGFGEKIKSLVKDFKDLYGRKI
ncbi:MAG: hypothetical protein HQ575_01070 [Candidatus Omnitrophica bacterium]|nr:hypothetical protein [Candidatus Omnitrophota bacterium]